MALIVYMPTDDEILAVLKKRGTGTMTYHLANIISFDERQIVETSFVLRRLKALEKAGKVERVPSTYRVQLCWRLVEGAS